MGVSLPTGEGAESAAINLARAAPFQFGDLEVAPATRQLRRGGQSETLEPRIMQVLVALARANGAVVSRDDLIASCWDGRIVGDNAIHRAISRLREIAATIGEGCFRLETVSKVGYRLIAIAPTPQPEKQSLGPAAQPHATAPPRHNIVWFGSALGALAIVAGLAVWARSPAVDPITIAVAARDANAKQLASGLAIDLSRLANARSAVAFVETAEGARPNYLLTVAERRQGKGAQTDLAIESGKTHELLWSASLSRAGNDRHFRERAAYAVSRVVNCAFFGNNNPTRSDSRELRQVFSGCDRLDEGLDSGPDDATIAIWRSIVARNPGNARALATLAFAEASHSTDYSTGETLEALRVAARTHLQKARAMENRLGLAYAAEAILLPSWRYGEKLATLDRGLALDPNCAALYAQKSYALMSVGFVGDSVVAAQKAVEVSPEYPSYRARLAMALAYGGLNGGAMAELAAAERIWPDSFAVKEARFRYDYRFGDAARLIREIDAGTPLPDASNSTFSAAFTRPFLLARADPTPENIDRVARLAERYSHPAHIALQALVTFGRVDQAFALMREPGRIAELRTVGTYILFRPNMRAFVLDRRFMPLADRLGLVQFWQSVDWPSFCGDKDLPYDCAAEARRLHPAKAV